jgi:hypothetical protein
MIRIRFLILPLAGGLYTSTRYASRIARRAENAYWIIITMAKGKSRITGLSGRTNQ